MYYENIFFIIIIGKEKEGPIRFKIGFASSSCERKREKKASIPQISSPAPSNIVQDHLSGRQSSEPLCIPSTSKETLSTEDALNSSMEKIAALEHAVLNTVNRFLQL